MSESPLTTRQISHLRLRERLRTVPEGNFDMAHLVAIHHHLLSGLGDPFTAHAGRLRSTEAWFGSALSPAPGRIQKAFQVLMGPVRESGYGRATRNGNEVAVELARVYSGLLVLQPFEKANALVAALFVRGLALNLGVELCIERLDARACEALAREGEARQLARKFMSVMDQAAWVSRPGARNNPFRNLRSGRPLLQREQGALPDPQANKVTQFLRSKIEEAFDQLGVSDPAQRQTVFARLARRDMSVLARQAGDMRTVVEVELSRSADASPAI